MKKVFGVLFSALLVFATFGVDNAQARSGRNAAFVGGLAVGALTGAAIASSADRGYYCDPRFEYCGRPVYRPRGLVWNDERGCWVHPRNYWGRCYR